jgi:plastocyanin
MKTVSEISSAIINSKFTNDELNDLARAVQFARAGLRNTVKHKIKVGDTVQWKNKSGWVTQGKLEKVAIKFATVNCNQMRWRVPISMLEVV